LGRSSPPAGWGKGSAIERSLAGTLGRTVEPVIRPLGFNWKIGVGLITSLAAREVIVGTLGTIYGMQPDAKSLGLQAACAATDPGRRRGLARLLRLRHAVHVHHCRGAARTGGWRWPLIQFAYMTTLAWGGAFLANRIVSALVAHSV